MQVEIEQILSYLKVQAEMGAKLHSAIEKDLKRLEELGYPKEKIEEWRRKFPPEIPPAFPPGTEALISELEARFIKIAKDLGYEPEPDEPKKIAAEVLKRAFKRYPPTTPIHKIKPVAMGLLVAESHPYILRKLF